MTLSDSQLVEEQAAVQEPSGAVHPSRAEREAYWQRRVYVFADRRKPDIKKAGDVPRHRIVPLTQLGAEGLWHSLLTYERMLRVLPFAAVPFVVSAPFAVTAPDGYQHNERRLPIIGTPDYPADKFSPQSCSSQLWFELCQTSPSEWFLSEYGTAPAYASGEYRCFVSPWAAIPVRGRLREIADRLIEERARLDEAQFSARHLTNLAYQSARAWSYQIESSRWSTVDDCGCLLRHRWVKTETKRVVEWLRLVSQTRDAVQAVMQSIQSVSVIPDVRTFFVPTYRHIERVGGEWVDTRKPLTKPDRNFDCADRMCRQTRPAEVRLAEQFEHVREWTDKQKDARLTTASGRVFESFRLAHLLGTLDTPEEKHGCRYAVVYEPPTLEHDEQLLVRLPEVCAVENVLKSLQVKAGARAELPSPVPCVPIPSISVETVWEPLSDVLASIEPSPIEWFTVTPDKFITVKKKGQRVVKVIRQLPEIEAYPKIAALAKADKPSEELIQVWDEELRKHGYWTGEGEDKEFHPFVSEPLLIKRKRRGETVVVAETGEETEEDAPEDVEERGDDDFRDIDYVQETFDQTNEGYSGVEDARHEDDSRDFSIVSVNQRETNNPVDPTEERQQVKAYFNPENSPRTPEKERDVLSRPEFEESAWDYIVRMSGQRLTTGSDDKPNTVIQRRGRGKKRRAKTAKIAKRGNPEFVEAFDNWYKQFHPAIGDLLKGRSEKLTIHGGWFVAVTLNNRKTFYKLDCDWRPSQWSLEPPEPMPEEVKPAFRRLWEKKLKGALRQAKIRRTSKKNARDRIKRAFRRVKMFYFVPPINWHPVKTVSPEDVPVGAIKAVPTND